LRKPVHSNANWEFAVARKLSACVTKTEIFTPGVMITPPVAIITPILVEAISVTADFGSIAHFYLSMTTASRLLE
jgi:hypothetical protein